MDSTRRMETDKEVWRDVFHVVTWSVENIVPFKAHYGDLVGKVEALRKNGERRLQAVKGEMEGVKEEKRALEGEVATLKRQLEEKKALEEENATLKRQLEEEKRAKGALKRKLECGAEERKRMRSKMLKLAETLVEDEMEGEAEGSEGDNEGRRQGRGIVETSVEGVGSDPGSAREVLEEDADDEDEESEEVVEEEEDELPETESVEEEDDEDERRNSNGENQLGRPSVPMTPSIPNAEVMNEIDAGRVRIQQLQNTLRMEQRQRQQQQRLSTSLGGYRPSRPLSESNKEAESERGGKKENPDANVSKKKDQSQSSGRSVITAGAGRLSASAADGSQRRTPNNVQLVTPSMPPPQTIPIEQKTFFKRIVRDCWSADQGTKLNALHSLENDASINGILPRLVRYISEQIVWVGENDGKKIYDLLRMLTRLVANPHLNLEPVISEIKKLIVRCAISKELTALLPERYDHWGVRDRTAKLLQKVLRRSNDDNEQVLDLFLDVLSNSEAYHLPSIYGAIATLEELGEQAVIDCLIPNVRAIGNYLEGEANTDEAKRVTDKILTLLGPLMVSIRQAPDRLLEYKKEFSPYLGYRLQKQAIKLRRRAAKQRAEEEEVVVIEQRETTTGRSKRRSSGRGDYTSFF